MYTAPVHPVCKSAAMYRIAPEIQRKAVSTHPTPIMIASLASKRFYTELAQIFHETGGEIP